VRFLFHSWEFPPNGMGVGSYVRQMSMALTQAGHRCVIATGSTIGCPTDEETACGRVVRFYRKDEIRSRKVALKVLELAREHRVDIIEGADHLGECARILRWKQRIPVVIKVHSSLALRVLVRSQVLYPWQHVTIGLALALRWKQVLAEWQSLVHADYLHAPSKRAVQEMIKQGVPNADRCRILSNPVMPVDSVVPPEAEVPTALFVGRLDIGKGIAYLPLIMETVWRQIPNAILEIAGPDEYARGIGSLKQWLVKKFGTGFKRVRFLGAQDSTGMDAAYRRAWVVIVPSRWDNFPGVVLEAMANGRAIVASPHGGMPEMLEGTDCVVADPKAELFAQAVAGFMAAPEKRYEAGLSARDKVIREYHPSKIAQDYERFAQSVCIGRIS